MPDHMDAQRRMDDLNEEENRPKKNWREEPLGQNEVRMSPYEISPKPKPAPLPTSEPIETREYITW